MKKQNKDNSANWLILLIITLIIGLSISCTSKDPNEDKEDKSLMKVLVVKELGLSTNGAGYVYDDVKQITFVDTIYKVGDRVKINRETYLITSK